MEHDLNEKPLFSWALCVGFTEAQYEEALKKIDSPFDINQLLKVLVDVKCHSSSNKLDSQQTNLGEPSDESINRAIQDKDSAVPSCYSSITSFPSTSLSDQSLESLQQSSSLRKIYIDGPNVARTHGKEGSFSWLGIKLCVDWFWSRQHRVKVFVPVERCQTADESILSYLKENLVEAPSNCNDDLFVIEAARKNNGVIVSNDQFRDEKRYNDELRRFIHANRLPYVFVDDLFLPAMDPLGRSGPTLDEFLRESRAQQPNNHMHRQLMRTKSHQRYQRTGFPKSNQSRCLSSTRSLPVGQHNASTTDSNFHPEEASNKSTYRPQQPVICEYQRQEIRRTTSAIYGGASAKESKAITSQPSCKRSLCKTKSNIL